MLTRRELIAAAADTAALAFAVGRLPVEAQAAPPKSAFLMFSKHLPDLSWSDLGRAVKDAGFDGVDLTVRAGGHVLPEKAAADLPRAIEAIRAHGLSVPMVTTELTSASDRTAKPLLETAARSGVRYFKAGYWRYSSSPDVRAQVAKMGEDLAGLAALARDCGIEMGVHNHTGYIGGAIWEIAPAMDRLDPKWAGYYFDPRHAVSEGGGGAFKGMTLLVAPRMKLMAVKDFYWEKTAKGWAIRDCPIGDGQVDWAWMGTTIAAAGFAGPISLHLEYAIPGATAEERTKKTLEAAVRDLAAARRVFGQVPA